VPHEGEAFSWEEFLRRSAVPTLLDGFREFLGRLDAERVEQFNQPTPADEWVDLSALITAGLGQ
jgi:hypothetical protein